MSTKCSLSKSLILLWLSLCLLNGWAMGDVVLRAEIDLPDEMQIEASIPVCLLSVLKDANFGPIPIDRDELGSIIDGLLSDIESMKGYDLVNIETEENIRVWVDEVSSDHPEEANMLQVHIDPAGDDEPEIDVRIPKGLFFLSSYLGNQVLEQYGQQIFSQLPLPPFFRAQLAPPPMPPVQHNAWNEPAAIEIQPVEPMASIQPSAAVQPEAPSILDQPAEADESMIDLSSYYNHGLEGGWHPNQGLPEDLPNDLSGLPAGIQEFGGVRFDVRGIIQLSGQELANAGGNFPERVMGILVGKPFKILHVLHATGWQAEMGTPIGSYVLNYTDGTNESLNIIYGDHVLDWWLLSGGEFQSEHSQVVWTGSNALAKFLAEQNGMQDSNLIRLFKTTWENPNPNVTVESIDYVSSMSGSAPFLVSLTVE